MTSTIRAAASVALMALVWGFDPPAASAQLAEMSLSPTTITFATADPDTLPVVTSAPVVVTYRIRQNSNQPWTLTVVANGDLVAGSATVDISNISWVATPAPPFQNGVMSKTVAQQIASGTGNQANTSQGQITFRLANSWNYVPGLYTQTVVFTLAAP